MATDATDNKGWSTVSKKPRKPALHAKRPSSPVHDIKKLFLVDKHHSTGGAGGRSLRDVRNLIYNYAWTRERRDEFKGDFVVSEFGVDRNVMHYSHFYDEQGQLRRTPHLLNRCNLLFANKQISDEFLEHIYSVNTLEIDVDLKRHDTPEAQAALDSIVARLRHTPCFQKFTRSIRVRIHFPDNYPHHSLPHINQSALHGISDFIDGCQNLSSLEISVVMMDGLNDYELRYAVFPFYPLKFVGWYIRVMNIQTYRFEKLQSEAIHHLNKAWDVFAEHGTLDAQIPWSDPKKQPAPSGRSSPNRNGQNLVAPNTSKNNHSTNGSIKKKAKKQTVRKSSGAPTPPPSVTPSVASDHPTTRQTNPPSPPSTPTSTLAPTDQLRDGLAPKQDDAKSPNSVDCKSTITEPNGVPVNNDCQTSDRTFPKKDLAPGRCLNDSKDIFELIDATAPPPILSSSSKTRGRGVDQTSCSELQDDSISRAVTNPDRENGVAKAPSTPEDPRNEKKLREREKQRKRAKRKRMEAAMNRGLPPDSQLALLQSTVLEPDFSESIASESTASEARSSSLSPLRWKEAPWLESFTKDQSVPEVVVNSVQHNFDAVETASRLKDTKESQLLSQVMIGLVDEPSDTHSTDVSPPRRDKLSTPYRRKTVQSRGRQPKEYTFKVPAEERDRDRLLAYGVVTIVDKRSNEANDARFDGERVEDDDARSFEGDYNGYHNGHYIREPGLEGNDNAEASMYLDEYTPDTGSEASSSEGSP